MKPNPLRNLTVDAPTLLPDHGEMIDPSPEVKKAMIWMAENWWPLAEFYNDRKTALIDRAHDEGYEIGYSDGFNIGCYVGNRS